VGGVGVRARRKWRFQKWEDHFHGDTVPMECSDADIFSWEKEKENRLRISSLCPYTHLGTIGNGWCRVTVCRNILEKGSRLLRYDIGEEKNKTSAGRTLEESTSNAERIKELRGK